MQVSFVNKPPDKKVWQSYDDLINRHLLGNRVTNQAQWSDEQMMSVSLFTGNQMVTVFIYDVIDPCSNLFGDIMY